MNFVPVNLKLVIVFVGDDGRNFPYNLTIIKK